MHAFHTNRKQTWDEWDRPSLKILPNIIISTQHEFSKVTRIPVYESLEPRVITHSILTLSTIVEHLFWRDHSCFINISRAGPDLNSIDQFTNERLSQWMSFVEYFPRHFNLNILPSWDHYYFSVSIIGMNNQNVDLSTRHPLWQ
jgi:hypothetical protein